MSALKPLNYSKQTTLTVSDNDGEVRISNYFNNMTIAYRPYEVEKLIGWLQRWVKKNKKTEEVTFNRSPHYQKELLLLDDLVKQLTANIEELRDWACEEITDLCQTIKEGGTVREEAWWPWNEIAGKTEDMLRNAKDKEAALEEIS